MAILAESGVEFAALAWLETSGWQVAQGPNIAPDMPATEPADFAVEVLTGNAVRMEVEEMLRAANLRRVDYLAAGLPREDNGCIAGDRQIGIVWHTRNLESLVLPNVQRNEANFTASGAFAQVRASLLPKPVTVDVRVRDSERFIGETA